MAKKNSNNLEQLYRNFEKMAPAVFEELCKTVKKEAKAAARRTKADSPARYGWYAMGWRAKEIETSRNKQDVRWRIYDGGKEVHLVHLLEFGHDLRNGKGQVYGHVDPIPHVLKNRDIAEKNIEDALPKMAERAVDKSMK